MYCFKNVLLSRRTAHDAPVALRSTRSFVEPQPWRCCYISLFFHRYSPVALCLMCLTKELTAPELNALLHGAQSAPSCTASFVALPPRSSPASWNGQRGLSVAPDGASGRSGAAELPVQLAAACAQPKQRRCAQPRQRRVGQGAPPHRSVPRLRRARR